MIVGLCGKKFSGKSACAKYLVKTRGYERIGFAKPIKDFMYALGLTWSQVEGDEKETPCALLGGKSPRFAMQTLGTEWGRDTINSDLWIRSWMARSAPYPNIVADDVRFGNEIDAIRSAGGVLIEVVTPIARRVQFGAVTANDGHSSETVPDGIEYTIYNDGSLEDLYDSLDTVITKHG